MIDYQNARDYKGSIFFDGDQVVRISNTSTTMSQVLILAFQDSTKKSHKIELKKAAIWNVPYYVLANQTPLFFGFGVYFDPRTSFDPKDFEGIEIPKFEKPTTLLHISYTGLLGEKESKFLHGDSLYQLSADVIALGIPIVIRPILQFPHM